MQITVLKSKIHRAVVTQSELDYVGSITIDADLAETAGLYEYEKVQIADINNGSRFETYVIYGERGSGIICLNGAAARCVQTNDRIIIMAYAVLDENEVSGFSPKVVFVDDNNRITKIASYEKHGLLKEMLMEKGEGNE